MAGFAALLRWLLVFLRGMAHNERLSLFHQSMSDNPIPPSRIHTCRLAKLL